MRKIVILLILINLAFSNMQAQNNADIQQIKKWYYGVKDAISESKKNKFEGNLYCDITERNVNGASWRAVGNYYVKTQYWYNDDPGLMIDDEKNPRKCLEMVIDNKEASVDKYYSEFLYHDGQLVFVFYKLNDESLRFYFKNKKLIKQIVDIREEYAPTAESIKQQGENYMRIFLASFGVKE